MDNFKIYYGEYCLSHWIKLILRSNIVLPPYQRNFVWTEDKVVKLIDSLRKKLFVPPVIIGTYFDNGIEKHYIIDGQQRLSAILLAYLRRFPNKGFELQQTEVLADDNDDSYDDEDKADKIDIRNWKLTEIQRITTNYKNISKIREGLKVPYYKDFNCLENLAEDFFDTTFLGFSYIKPNEINENEQKRYYSSIFRNINISGQMLTPEESRSSLYWLDSNLEEFFKPSCFDKVIIDNNKIDFARYLAFTAEYLCKYSANPNSGIVYQAVAKGYGTKIRPYEEYIENFVYHCVGDREASTFRSFNEMFLNKDMAISRIKKVYEIFQKVRKQGKFVSIIDADYYLFGLIFWGVFMGKEFDEKKFSDLILELERQIAEIKKDSAYIKRPSAVGRIRERLFSSILSYRLVLVE